MLHFHQHLNQTVLKATRAAIVPHMHRMAEKVAWQMGKPEAKRKVGDEGLCGIIMIDHRGMTLFQQLSESACIPQDHEHVLPLIFLRYSSILPGNFCLI